MFSRFKSALYSAVGVEEDGVPYGSDEKISQKNMYDPQNRYLLKSKEKHLTYCRPAFLQLSSADEVSVTADHAMRPIICPRSFLPWDTGYAEAVNAGKSKHNEDQGCVYVGYLSRSLACKPHSAASASASGAANVGSVQSRPLDAPAASLNSSSHAQSSVSCVNQTSCNGPLIPTEGVMNGCIDACSVEEECRSKSKNSHEVATERNKDEFSDPLHSPPANSEVRFDSHTSEVTINSANSEDNIINNSDANHFSIDGATSDIAKNMNSLKMTDPNCTLGAEATQTTTFDSNTDASPSGTPHFCPSVPDEKLFVDEGSGRIGVSVPYYYFAVFDGHAGWGAAVYASQHLHHILHTSLAKVAEFIIPDLVKQDVPAWQQLVNVDATSVVVGALEQAFYHMDKKIEQDRHRIGVGGGCTACIALFIMGKLYVANAGDSRATACLHGAPHSMSYDFTPETENYRIRKQGAQRPDLLGGEYTPVEFVRRPLKRELGVSLLCRHPYMARGWVYKKITEEDLKVPLVCGSGKRSRVMATIGVTRGFGDHDLKAQLTSVHIKPFLSSEPEVRILNLEDEELCDTDALILATDGLWDIITNEKAVSTLLQSMSRSLLHFPSSDPSRHKYRYMSAAQDLVMGARGKLTERNWRTSDNKHATIDDIAVFVIPLKPYQEEHRKWKELFETRTVDVINSASLAQQSDTPPSAAHASSSQTTTAISREAVHHHGSESKQSDCSSSQPINESQSPKPKVIRDVNLPSVQLHSAMQDAGTSEDTKLECQMSTKEVAAEANDLKSEVSTEVPQCSNERVPVNLVELECSDNTPSSKSLVSLDDKSFPAADLSIPTYDPSFCSISTLSPGFVELPAQLSLADSSISGKSDAVTKITSECLGSAGAKVESAPSVSGSSTDEGISVVVTERDALPASSHGSEQCHRISRNNTDGGVETPDGLSSKPADLVAEFPAVDPLSGNTAEDAHVTQQ